MSRLVLDASVAVAWCFEDETTSYSERILDLLSTGNEALVPSIWPLEVSNALWVAERRRRVTETNATRFLTKLSGFPISLDSPGIARHFDPILAISHRCNLSAYDAAYLELAIRSGLPLATLDNGLKRAAKLMRVDIAG